jgi:hypothetical protein
MERASGILQNILRYKNCGMKAHFKKEAQKPLQKILVITNFFQEMYQDSFQIHVSLTHMT